MNSFADLFDDNEELMPSINNNCSKFEEHTIWHEYGHIFATALLQTLNYPLQNYLKLKLCNDGDRAEVIPDYGFLKDLSGFDKINESLSLTFCYLSGGVNIPEHLSKKGKNILIDINFEWFYALSIIYISGGLFDIYSCKEDPNNEDFELCFKKDYFDHDRKKPRILFENEAGNDWEKLMVIQGIKNWKLEDDLKAFRKELFTVYKEVDIFKKLENEIAAFNKEYNGSIIDDPQKIARVMQKIHVILKNEDILIQKIKNLLSNYISKIKT